MTVPEFLRSLPHDPALALAQIDGALIGESVDPHWSEDERLEVVAEQLRRRQAMEKRR